MLTREIMGCLALAILWVNTLLVVAVAAKTLGALWARRRGLRLYGEGRGSGYGLVKGRVARGEGPDGAFARRHVEQLGRSAGDPERGRTIVFSDRSLASEVFGGAVRLEGEGTGEGDGTEEVEVAAATAGAEVWLEEAALREAAVCPSPERFDAAFEDARKARGFARAVEANVGADAAVWIAGDVVRAREGGPLRVAASRERGLLVSAFDPRPRVARAILLSIVALVGMLIGAAVCTALALTRPCFGTVSMIGGGLSLVFFLLVQPAGTWLRDAVLMPHAAFLRGEWKGSPEARKKERARPARSVTSPKAP